MAADSGRSAPSVKDVYRALTAVGLSELHEPLSEGMGAMAAAAKSKRAAKKARKDASTIAGDPGVDHEGAPDGGHAVDEGGEDAGGEADGDVDMLLQAAGRPHEVVTSDDASDD